MPQQGGVEGLLGNSGGLQNLAGNPLFNMGMAMLSNRYDASVNPAQAILGALQTSGAQQRTLEDRQRDEELREKLIEYFKNMQTQQMGQQPGRVEGLLGQGPQFGQQTDPMQSLYRIGWENALNPR
jgi:hypothetical protein